MKFLPALALLAACQSTTDTGGQPAFEAGSPPDFYVGYASGRRAFKDSFAAKDAVYLDSVFGELPVEGPRAPRYREDRGTYVPMGDYYFDVIDPGSGRSLSQDTVECRRFHVDGTGVIDQVYACAGPGHVQGRDTNPYRELGIAGGGITVQLAPYLDSSSAAPDQPGAALYHLQVTPVQSYPLGILGVWEFQIEPAIPTDGCVGEACETRSAQADYLCC